VPLKYPLSSQSARDVIVPRYRTIPSSFEGLPVTVVSATQPRGDWRPPSLAR